MWKEHKKVKIENHMLFKAQGEKKFMIAKCFLGVSTSLFSSYHVFP